MKKKLIYFVNSSLPYFLWFWFWYISAFILFFGFINFDQHLQYQGYELISKVWGYIRYISPIRVEYLGHFALILTVATSNWYPANAFMVYFVSLTSAIHKIIITIVSFIAYIILQEINVFLAMIVSFFIAYQLLKYFYDDVEWFLSKLTAHIESLNKYYGIINLIKRFIFALGLTISLSLAFIFRSSFILTFLFLIPLFS